MLGSGLTLALLPSLLLALDEPVSLRGALIGAAGVLVLAVGVQQRLAAPFVLGAVTTGILAVRHLEPYADAVPRWISLGGVGLALLVVGVTWEARRRNLETARPLPGRPALRTGRHNGGMTTPSSATSTTRSAAARRSAASSSASTRASPTDEVLRPLYPEEDLAAAEDRFAMFLEQYWGGPTTYSDQRGHPRLRMRHAPFAVTPTARDHWLLHFRAALDEADLTPEQDAQFWEYVTHAAQFMINTLEDLQDRPGG